SISTLPRGAQRNIELGFRHINAHKAWLVTHEELLSARPCTYGLSGTKQLYGLEGVQDVTTHAPLRSPWTKARAVCHVRGLGDGDSPTSLTKDTRLEVVACRRWFGKGLGREVYSALRLRLLATR